MHKGWLSSEKYRACYNGIIATYYCSTGACNQKEREGEGEGEGEKEGEGEEEREG